MTHFSKNTSLKSSCLLFLYCLLAAAGCLLLCSKSSPLYPINDWSDANIYFSMGKGMLSGRVLYRDIYDHKGPLLYALHALCCFISPRSFFGVWLMEVIAGAFFLMGTWKIFRLYDAKPWMLSALPLLGMLVFSSFSFQYGDSAEEFCIPLLTWALYDWLLYLKTDYPKGMRPRVLLRQGVLCGCILWTKFTLLGLHGMWFLLVCGAPALRRQWKDVWRTALWFAAGVLLATLPWVFYFGFHGALLDWFKTYLYDNLFLYSGGEATGALGQLRAILRSAWDWFRQNLTYSLPVLLGLIWMTFSKSGTEKKRWAYWPLPLLAGLGVFIGGKSYVYYGLPLAAFGGMGLLPLCLWLDTRLSPAIRQKNVALCAVACALSFTGCYFLSPNVSSSFLQPRESTMQYQLAAAIPEGENATLLNYGFMDAGFYTAAGITPTVKYFHQTNVPLQEMLDEQERYLQEELVDYVVTRGKVPEGFEERYVLIAEAETPGFWYPKAYLFRRRALPHTFPEDQPQR